MNTVTVNASRSYQIHIGQDLIPHIGDYLSALTKVRKVMILSDSNVWPIYGDIVARSLQDNGYSACHYIIPAGEASKSGENYLHILNFLAENQLTRTDCIVALGGGVVGDLAGFVSATYLRGVSYIQVPTSLLAMVDSSVGGKTAIDLPAGKNLAGAFYQPDLVLCDLTALQTLPKDVFLDGCAEVIKYGILFDAALFEHLKAHGPNFEREYVVTRCVELKRDIVNRDEKDLGERQLLNLGHTLGHSIEANSAYTVSHGRAVAIGTSLIAACAVSAGLSDEMTFVQIAKILQKFDLPVTTTYTAQEIAQAALRDKKRTADTISLVIPQSIGQCIIYPYPINDLQTYIKAGLVYADQALPR